MKKNFILTIAALLLGSLSQSGALFAAETPTAKPAAANPSMDKMWGESVGQAGIDKSADKGDQ